MSTIKITLDTIGVNVDEVQHCCASGMFTLCLDDAVTVEMPNDVAKRVFTEALDTILAHDEALTWNTEGHTR